VVSTTVSAASRTERECLRAAGLIGLGVVGVAVLLWAATFPGWPLAAGVVLSVLVLAALLLVAGREPPPAARWLRPLGVVAALAILIGGGIVVERASHAAMLARFESGRSTFEGTVAAAGPVPIETSDSWLPFPGACPDRLGSYRIAECHAFTGGFMFLQQRNAWGDDAGFAYAPDGLSSSEDPQVLPSSGFTHLVGPWYAWSCGC
jgi:hypothetical protein